MGIAPRWHSPLPSSRSRAIALAAAAVVLVALWIAPVIAFPHPATNEAVVLSSIGWFLFPVTIVAAILSALALRVLRRTLAAPVGLGVFLLGVAAAAILGLVTFADVNNDRFGPLVFMPVYAVMGALSVLLVALFSHRWPRGDTFAGGASGAVAAAIVVLWIQLRGAGDWLVAPYGCDVFVLIALLAAAIVFLADRVDA